MNGFISGVMASKGSAYTENGAISYASTGKELVDQFGKAASYRGRDYSVVADDMKRLWAENPEAALKFPFYLRLITREVKMGDGTKTEKVQRGAGARDEAYKRFVWLMQNHPDEFYRNLYLIPVVGSWKDIWQILFYAEDAGVKADKEKFFEVIAEGLASESQVDLVKKYLPRIRSTKKCKTVWALCSNKYAKEFVSWASRKVDGGFDSEAYRHMKASGEAHVFQKLMCGQRYDEINFKTIPGKALLNMVSGKFLTNHDLYNKYVEWIKSQPVAKFNGYPYELGAKLTLPGYGWGRSTDVDVATKITIDKQFDNLIATGKKNEGAIKGNVWCALDTSGSMGSTIPGSNVTAMNVCLSLGIYFATLNEGAFHKNVIMFDSTSRVKQLKGSFSEMWNQVPANAMGSTNFQSVVDEIVRIRRSNPNISLEDYPKTLLVVSDMQFNPSGCYWYGRTSRAEELSNVEAAQAKLRSVFPKEFVDEFKFIWWNVTDSRQTDDMPSTLDDKASYFFSGFDGAIVSFLLGGDAEIVDDKTGKKRMPTAEELVQIALSQEVISLVR